MTAGKLILKGRCYNINKCVLQQAQEAEDAKQCIEDTVKEQKDITYLEICSKADEVIKKIIQFQM